MAVQVLDVDLLARVQSQAGGALLVLTELVEAAWLPCLSKPYLRNERQT
jgi:hypothetical protein